MSLRLYFQSLLILRIVLDLEIQILAKTKFMGIHRRIQDPIKHL